MDYRSLGASGLNVPAIGLGSASFRTEAGAAGIAEKTAARIVDIAIERGAAFIDAGDIHAAPDETLGRLLARRRGQLLIGTKAGLRSGPGPNDTGASRAHLIDACERSLKRLGTDHIDLFQIHSFDGRTPVEETLMTLDGLIRDGKVRYIGCSNHAGWQLMKCLAASERNGWARFVSHQIAYSLAVRDGEWELLPLAADQNVATLAWGPLAGGALGGRYGRGGAQLNTLPHPRGTLTALPSGQLAAIVDCIAEISRESGASHAQVAIAWLLLRPTVATLFVGATSAGQFEASLDALDVRLTGDQIARLDDVSARPAAFPHVLQQEAGAERNPQLAGSTPAVRVDRIPAF